MKTGNSFKVDTFLELDKDFWQELETECVAECCGIDAFDFSDNRIKEVVTFYDAEKIKENINKLIKELEYSSKAKVSSYILNASLSKVEFIEKIKKIEKNV